MQKYLITFALDFKTTEYYYLDPHQVIVQPAIAKMTELHVPTQD